MRKLKQLLGISCVLPLAGDPEAEPAVPAVVPELAGVETEVDNVEQMPWTTLSRAAMRWARPVG